MSKNKYFSVGKILAARGIYGEIKVQTWTDSPKDFLLIERLFLDVDAQPLEIINKKIHKSQVILKLKNINSRNEAELLRGKKLYAFREDIPLAEDRYFIEDLKGLKITDAASGENYGTLKDVMNTGANDIYVINNEAGKEFLLPIIDGTIEKIDLENEFISVNPIKGVFDDN